MSDQDLKNERIKILTTRVIAGESVVFRQGRYNTPKRIFVSDAVQRIVEKASDCNDEDELQRFYSMVAGAAIGARQELMTEIHNAIGDIIEENFDAIVAREKETA